MAFAAPSLEAWEPDGTETSQDPLHDDSLWDDPPSPDTVASASIGLADHSVLVRTDGPPSLPLPGEADRSIRVSSLDDPFDDSEELEDPFEEPLIEEGTMDEMESGKTDTENESSGEDWGDRSESATEMAEPTEKALEEAPNQPWETPSPTAGPADSVPSTLQPVERGDRATGVPPERGSEDFSADSIQPTPKEERDMEQREREMMAEELIESEKNCAEETARLRSARIDSIDLNIRVAGKPGEDYPYECALGNDTFNPRCWPATTYLWKASGLCHKPLYFEQVPLERYGHSWGPYLQPLVSGAHFFATVPILPYKMGLKTPQECVYSLGYYRPGSCAPYLLDPVPFTWRAALYETGFVVGAAAAVP